MSQSERTGKGGVSALSLRSTCVRRPTKSLKSGALIEDPYLLYTVTSLEAWGEEELARDILDKVARDDAWLLTLVRASRAKAGFRGIARAESDVYNTERLSKVTDLDDVRRRLEAIDPSSLDDGDRLTRADFLKYVSTPRDRFGRPLDQA